MLQNAYILAEVSIKPRTADKLVSIKPRTSPPKVFKILENVTIKCCKILLVTVCRIGLSEVQPFGLSFQYSGSPSHRAAGSRGPPPSRVASPALSASPLGEGEPRPLANSAVYPFFPLMSLLAIVHYGNASIPKDHKIELQSRKIETRILKY